MIWTSARSGSYPVKVSSIVGGQQRELLRRRAARIVARTASAPRWCPAVRGLPLA